MFFYVLILPVLVASAGMIWHLRLMKRHDRVLFRLCDNRRAVMALIREGNYNLPREDYVALRSLLEALNKAIHDYQSWKTSFSFSRAMERLEIAQRLDEQAAKDGLRNPEIARVYREFILNIAIGFLAFTPISDWLLKASPFIVKVLFSVGRSRIAAKLNSLKESVIWARQHIATS
jgi:hypothetical protein